MEQHTRCLPNHRRRGKWRFNYGDAYYYHNAYLSRRKLPSQEPISATMQLQFTVLIERHQVLYIYEEFV
jgi:hypothetical protein